MFPPLVARVLPLGVTEADANTAVFLDPAARSPREQAAYYVVQYVYAWLDRVLECE